MTTDKSSGKLIFRNPQIKIRSTNTEDIKAIIEQRERNRGRSRKGPPSATVTPTLLNEHGRDRYGHEILNAYLKKADVSPHRLADPNENIDDIIAEVVKAKYGVSLAELPASAEMDDLLKLESLELNKTPKRLHAPQERNELQKYNPRLAMYEIITSFDGKLYHVELALSQETREADSDDKATGHHLINRDNGASRGLTVLEVLCGDGVWCNQLLLEHPTWVVEGIDRVVSPAWAQSDSALSVASAEGISAVRKEAKNKVKDPSGANKPRFAVFPIPSIAGLPIPVQTYDFIRGRDIFTTTHNWKLLLDDLHKILKMGGAIELIELDPRPRSSCAGSEERPEASYGKSAATTFPESFEDRLKEASDPSLLQESWISHALHCLGYSSMPERIYATEVKSWVEASGFCQVKEEIIKIPVGDWMEDPELKTLGERMLRHLSSQLKNKLDLAATSRGEYDSILGDMMNSKNRVYMNLHIVTGRRPNFPRIGDLMPDSTRYGIAGAANRDHLASCDET